jgi:hypothetical protein
MDIKQALINEHSKKQTTAIVRYIGHDKNRFKTLIDIFLTEDYRLNQRAAWPLSNVCLEHPEMIRPYIGKLVKNLTKTGNHDAVIRNTLRIFQDMDIPEKHCGPLLDICFSYIRNTTLPFAIRTFAITVAANICRKYPELKPELKLLLTELNSFPQPASINSRLKRALKEL